MSFSLENKVCVVTGALGLLGREHCKALHHAGASVVVADLNEAACQDWARSLGPRNLGVGLDVTQKTSIEGALKCVLSRWNRVDVLVNNAAINDQFENPAAQLEESRFENYPETLWKKMMDVNVTGTFLMSQVFGTQMALQDGGSIINIGSTYGLVAPDQNLYKKPSGEQLFFKTAAYPTSKGAVIAFTRFLAAYWGKNQVRVNTLTPGGVENRQDEYFIESYSAKTPLGRMATPEDYHGALVFLASDASKYVTGANLVVDGGFTAW